MACHTQTKHAPAAIVEKNLFSRRVNKSFTLKKVFCMTQHDVPIAVVSARKMLLQDNHHRTKKKEYRENKHHAMDRATTYSILSRSYISMASSKLYIHPHMLAIWV